MGVDTKGLVATPCKDAFFAVSMVEKALNKLIKPHLPLLPWQLRRKVGASAAKSSVDMPAVADAEATASAEKKNPDYASVVVDFGAAEQTVLFLFSYAGEHRTLWLFFDCDCDNTDKAPQSLSLSMGCWGQSDLFMQTALRALSPLGPVYFDHSDCDDIEKARLDVEPLTLVSAFREGLLQSYGFDLDRWKKLYDNGMMREGTCEEVLGIPEDTVKVIQAAHYEEAIKMLQEICAPIEASV